MEPEVLPIAYQNLKSNYATRFHALYVRESLLARTKQFSVLEITETIVVALLSGICWFDKSPKESNIYDMR